MPTPAAAKERERLDALYDLRILQTEPSPAFDRLCTLAKDIFGVPIALVSLVDQDRQWFKAKHGVNFDETPRADAFCNVTIQSNEILIVQDATQDPRFRSSRLVTEEPSIRFYAGAPLILKSGHRVGSICVIDKKPRLLSIDDAKILQDLADGVVAELQRHKQSLVETRERQRKIATERQGEAAAGIGSWEWNLTKEERYLSDGFYRLFGYEPNEVVDGQGLFLRHTHPDDLLMAQEAAKAIARGESISLDLRIIRRDGKLRWLSSRGEALSSEECGDVRMVGILCDVTDAKLAQIKLEESEERYRALTEVSASVVWRSDPVGYLLEERGWIALTQQEWVNRPGDGWAEKVHPEDRQSAIAVWRHCVETGHVYDDVFRVRMGDDSYHWFRMHAVAVRNADGSIREWIGTTTDIEEQRQAELTLAASEERMRLALEAGKMFAWDVDTETGHVIRSGNAMRIIGEVDEDYAAWLQRVDARDRHKFQKAFAKALGGIRTSVEFRYNKPDGSRVWLELTGCAVGGKSTSSTRVIGVCFDISDRKASQEMLWHAANHDALTGLPNRQHLQEYLTTAIEQADGTRSLSVIIVDLDHFKDINDTLGHDAGDALLQITAARLRSCMTPEDFVARLGGDEFAIFLSEAASPHLIAEHILAALRQPFTYDGRTLECRASLGFARYPMDGQTSSELMKFADMALYRAKRNGRNGFAGYSKQLQEATEARVRLGMEIGEGLKAHEFAPFYQPIICLRSGNVAGFEALARWQHPTKGLLSPYAFSMAFDDPELSRQMTSAMFSGVILDALEWRARGLAVGRLAINLSAADFADLKFASSIVSQIDEAGLPRSLFKIEVTEGVFLGQGTEHIALALQQLNRAGIEIALDDFGTGYASLTHLKTFPVDQLKIDQSFVRTLETDKHDEGIVRAVTQLGQGMGMHIIAEGVETKAQLRYLQSMGCDFGQGFLFAKPMAASRVPHFLRESATAIYDLVVGELHEIESVAVAQG